MSRRRRFLVATATIVALAALVCGATRGGRVALDGSARRAGSDHSHAVVAKVARPGDARSTSAHPRPVLLAAFLGALAVLVTLIAWAQARAAVLVTALAAGCHRQRGPPALA
jgi:hypothetical protein